MHATEFATGLNWERRTSIRLCATHAIESTTGLNDSRMLPIPQDVAAQLPKTGRARLIVPAGKVTGAARWRLGACRQFLRDDSSEDATDDSCR